MKKSLILLGLATALVGCVQSNIHTHKKVEFGIEYGKDPQHLDNLMTASCEYFYHSGYFTLRDNVKCDYGEKRMNEYSCAVDGRLYFVKGGFRKAAAMVPLDGLYCKELKPIETTLTYRIHSTSFFKATETFLYEGEPK